MKRQSGKLMLEGVNILPAADSVQHLNAMTLTGKTPVHYAFVTAAVLLALFTAVSAFVCATTPIPRRRWLWIVFVLLGFGTLSLNWTTGEIGYQIVTAHLFATGFLKPLYGPMVLDIAFPLGAIIFWFKRRGWIEQSVNAASRDAALTV